MRFKNQSKDNFLKSIPLASIELPNDTLSKKCKFNFAYFDGNPPGQKFEDWTHANICKLLDKLKAYSQFDLKHWEEDGLLVIYNQFPTHTEFTHPKHVPHQARWGRFRLGNKIRLVGFVLPSSFHQTPHGGTNYNFDCNTFYIVFLDENHKFYLTERP